MDQPELESTESVSPTASDECAVSAFPFMQLPAEIRCLVYKHAIATSPVDVSDVRLILWPRSTFVPDAAECLADLADPDTKNVPTRAKIQTVYGENQDSRCCSGCGELLEGYSGRARCWDCKTYGHAFLLVSKQVHAECVESFISRTPLWIRQNMKRKAFVTLVYCLRSQDVCRYVRVVEITMSVTQTSRHNWMRRRKCAWKYVRNPAKLILLFPNLKKLILEILTDAKPARVQSSAEGFVDARLPIDLQAFVEVMSPTFAANKQIDVEVEGRFFVEETKKAINSAFKTGDMGGYDIEDATLRALTKAHNGSRR